MRLIFRKSYRLLPKLKLNVRKVKRSSHHHTDSQSSDGGITLGVVIGAVVFLWSGSFMLSFIPVVAIPLILATQKKTSHETVYFEDERKLLHRHKKYTQQKAKVKIITHNFTQFTQEDTTQYQSEDCTRKLLPLLEVDKF